MASSKKNDSILSCAPPEVLENPLVNETSINVFNKLVRSLDKKNKEEVSLKIISTGYIKEFKSVSLDGVKYINFNLVNENGESIRSISLLENPPTYEKIFKEDGLVGSITDLKNDLKIKLITESDISDYDKRPVKEITILK